MIRTDVPEHSEKIMPNNTNRRRSDGPDRCRLHGGNAEAGRRQAHLWRGRRHPERLHRRAAADRRHRLDPYAPRGSRRVCGRRRGASHRRTRGLRRKLRSRQSASHQRPVRLPSQPRAGAGDRRAYSKHRDRHRLFPGDPSGNPVQGVQPLCRAGVAARPAAAGSRTGDPRRCRPPRRRCRRHSRRRRAATARQEPAAVARAVKADVLPAGRGARPTGLPARRRQERDPALRRRLRRRP